MPEISADFRTFTFRVKPGIYFADDPAFKGKRARARRRGLRLLVQARLRSEAEEPGAVESRGRRNRRPAASSYDEAVKSKKPFDYDSKVEGLQAIDRYTLRVRLHESRPRHLYLWAARDILGAVAREVVEVYGDRIMAHPVGTGPFRLGEWRRSSRIVLARNPTYREHVYDAEPNADDAEGQAIAARFKGRRLPMIDRVEISIIEQAQPRWLSFLNGEQDFIERLPNEFVDQAVPAARSRPTSPSAASAPTARSRPT